jgi:hypothetical protein
MAEETIEQFLDRRERDLIAKATALRSQLAPVEAELIKIQRARASLPPRSGLVLKSPQFAEQTNVLRSTSLSDLVDPQTASSLASISDLVASTFATRSIKDLIIQALLDAYPNGATIADLRHFIHNGYGREIGLGSLRTQIHRLKHAGILQQEQYSDLWNFQTGKRALYSRFDHPSSRKSDVLLQDDPGEPEEAQLQYLKGKKLPWEQGGQT